VEECNRGRNGQDKCKRVTNGHQKKVKSNNPRLKTSKKKAAGKAHPPQALQVTTSNTSMTAGSELLNENRNVCGGVSVGGSASFSERPVLEGEIADRVRRDVATGSKTKILQQVKKIDKIGL
jgi:hypothetical protein